MFYFILIVLAAVMFEMGFRANELYKLVKARKDSEDLPEEQIKIWYGMGGFNLLLLENELNSFLSFLSGLGVIIAYAGLWMCALGKWAGIALIIAGSAVCALIQLSLVKKMKTYMQKYQEETGEDPAEFFTGKTGPAHAVFNSVKIGIGKALSVLLICSVVGILLYFIGKAMGRSLVSKEEQLEREENRRMLIDEFGNLWRINYLDEDKWVLNGPKSQRLCVKASELIEKLGENNKVLIGSHSFRWAEE